MKNNVQDIFFIFWKNKTKYQSLERTVPFTFYIDEMFDKFISSVNEMINYYIPFFLSEKVMKEVLKLLKD